MLSDDTFRFLNTVRRVVGPRDWDAPEADRLWRYNLHYFEDLTASGAQDRDEWHRRLIQRWIDEVPSGAGTGWEPYPCSLRIVNWIKGSLARRESDAPLLDRVATDSLASQVRWLSKLLEFHILANHLWANAKALVFAGLYFQGPEADAWREQGVRLLSQELREQVLRDGGHFERSPMYHALFLEDILDLLNCSRCFPGVLPDAVERDLFEAAPRMLRWLRLMTHPDGGIAFFNDAAFGIAPDHGQLAAHAGALGVAEVDERCGPIEILADSGYARLTCGKAVAICDCADLGPSYQPGHGHADTLSFELSFGRERVLVNGGTSTYEPGDARLIQRSTAAHNTVVVNGRNSSEVWSSFRVGRRARPFNVRWSVDQAGRARLAAAHDGYSSLLSKVIHRREWLLGPTTLSVVDRIDGPFRTAAAYFHLHPQATVSKTADGVDVGLRSADRLRIAPGGSAMVHPSQWHSAFGQTDATHALVIEIPITGIHETRISW